MLWRIRQFFLYAFNVKINDEQIKFIKKYLNDEEIKLFNMMHISERKHCVNVAIGVKNYIQKYGIINNENELIKASLLHDIGKVYYKLSLLDRIELVVLDKITMGKIKKYKNSKKIYLFYNHAYMGYELLKNINENKRVLYLVRNHHNKDIKDDLELNILKKFDNRN